MVDACAECGAPVPEGGTCRDHFHALLALEAQVPGAAGSLTHFYTVACYQLQHPDSSHLTAAALAGLAAALADTLDGRADVAELRRRAGEGARAAGRVTRRAGDPPPVWRRGAWSLSAADVLTARPEDYPRRVQEWARSIREDLAE